ncbi:schlafen-like protein 1 [Trachemys scripta elegans]|uniref:schlafen-like protein 1 n=1 Tax=Trachemys scripta elegans TaxID=31138 RepID=UPI0015578610|nr:schlafen-like protein 1 [Trachemys scripta elegans]
MDNAPESSAEEPMEETAGEPLAEPVEEALPCLTHVYTLYIGNLNPKYSREVLCSMLKDILGTASLPLQRHDIEVVKKPRRAYALVQVATELSLENVLKQLQVASDMEQHLLRELVMKGKTLVVGEGRRASPSAKECQESDTQMNGASAPESPMLGRLQSGKSRLWGAEEAQPSPCWKGPPQARKLMERPAVFLSGTRSDSAIVRREIVGQERLFYGAFMGSETRNVEFKRGGGEYLSVTLKHHVRKYVCAFLNSEGGSLFVGVEDSGFVHGVMCGHKEEDRIRLLIDSILKGFKPQVFPDAYTLTFIPVVKAEDTGIFLKVIRLSVHLPRQQGELLLYETDQGEVYLRRDGSIQGPLSGSAIQEWCRQKWTGEVRKLEERIESLMKEKESLQQQINQQRSPNPRSRFCTIL